MTSWRRLGLAEDGRATKDAVASGFSRTPSSAAEAGRCEVRSQPLASNRTTGKRHYPRQNSFPSSDPMTSFPPDTAGEAASGPPASNWNTLLPVATSST